MSRSNLTERIVLALCPAAAPSASADIKYHVWRSLRAAHEAGADTVAAVVLAAPDIFEDVNLRRSAAAYSLDITAAVFCDRHLSSAAEQQLLAELLLKALPHWPEVDVALWTAPSHSRSRPFVTSPAVTSSTWQTANHVFWWDAYSGTRPRTLWSCTWSGCPARRSSQPGDRARHGLGLARGRADAAEQQAPGHQSHRGDADEGEVRSLGRCLSPSPLLRARRCLAEGAPAPDTAEGSPWTGQSAPAAPVGMHTLSQLLLKRLRVSLD